MFTEKSDKLLCDKWDLWRADMTKREYEALRNALASVGMEGFEITEQTEKDCIRLLNGEVSVEELVKEIMSRPKNT